MTEGTTVLTKLKNAQNIYDKYKLKNIFLTGSYARGEQTSTSDVDLYIQSKVFLDIYKYMNLKFELEKVLGKNVDLIMDNNLKKGVKKHI